VTTEGSFGTIFDLIIGASRVDNFSAVDLRDENTIGSIIAASSRLSGSLDVQSSIHLPFVVDLVLSPDNVGTLNVPSQPSLDVGSYVTRYINGALRLLHNVADFNGDGGVDSDDVSLFFALWDVSDIRADLTGDGGVDSDDVIFFFGLWDRGGR
jgi:hypothetical protein